MMKDLKVTAEHVTSWDLAYELALATEGKVPTTPVTDKWVYKMLTAEHSPLRGKLYKIRIENCPTFVWTHFVRHKIGVEWFIQSQRDDRRDNPAPRAEMPQGSPNNGVMLINAQALINISRKRLCNKASEETREVWKVVRDAVSKIDSIMAAFMTRECVYRGGFCPEMKSCGYAKSNRP